MTDVRKQDDHESPDPTIAEQDTKPVEDQHGVEAKQPADQGEDGKGEKKLADTQIKEHNNAPVVTEEQSSVEKKRTHEETEHDSVMEPSSPSADVAKRVEERPKSPLKKSYATSKATFGTMGSSAASPFGSLTSSSSPFASLQPSTTEDAKYATPKSTFGAAFSGSSFSSLASPAKKLRTQDNHEEDGEDAEENVEEDEALKVSSKQKAFGNMLEKEDESTKSEQQYVQVSQPLVEQDHITGEESETTVHSIRAKLFIANKDGWKERGIGQVRINVAKDEKPAPRIVMRADAVFKLLLNAPLFPGMEVKNSGYNDSEGLSSDKFVRMVVFEESKPVTIAFKFSNSNHARDFREKVLSLLPEESKESSPLHEQPPPSPTANPSNEQKVTSIEDRV